MYSRDDINVSRKFERNTDRQQTEQDIFSNNFGGLNTTASDINCPFTDSPLMYNCNVLLSGKIEKRRGTKLISSEALTPTQVGGYGAFTVVTGLNYAFLVEKILKDIKISKIDNDSATAIITKTNVFDDKASTVRPSFTRTSEVEPRIIICTGVNQPVQLRIVERQQLSASVSTSITFTNAQRYEHSTTSNTVVYVNRVLTTPSSISYSGGTLTITFSSDLAVGDVVDLCMITWQHMVEALFLTGDRISQQVTRLNSTATDQVVEVPERLRIDPIFNYPGSEFQYGLYAYQTSAWNDLYTFDSALTPTTSTEYSFGSGAFYDSTAGGQVTPAPLFATFGALDASGNPIEVMFVRQHDLNAWLNGGVDLAGDDLKVYADNTLLTQSTSATTSSGTFRQFWLITSAGDIATATTTVSRFITWEASDNVGIEEDAKVSIIHTCTNFIGTSATTDVELYKDGACEPLFGVGKYFNYFTGSFPTNVSVFQSRLVFAGMPGDPLTVLFSEVNDSIIPNRLYRSFQIEALYSSATDAFDVRVNSKPDDYITGLTVWQDSMLIMTRQAVYRLAFGQQGLSALTARTLLTASIGLVNPYSVILAKNYVYYLSDVGVFKVLFTVDSQSYEVEEISRKIRDKFGITANPNYSKQSFLTYDSVKERLYVSLPQLGETRYNTALFVYELDRQAWTEYRTPNNFNLYHLLSYQDKTLGGGILGVCSIANDTKKGLIRFDAEKYLDFYEEQVADGTNTVFSISDALTTLTYTTVDKQQTYSTYDLTKDGSFRLLETTEVNDVYVELDGNPLTFGVDYYKYRDNDIYLQENPGAGKTLTISYRNPSTDYEATKAKYEISTPIANHSPVYVAVDNYEQRQEQDYTVGGTNTIDITFNSAPAENAIVQVGVIYPCIYTSPLLTLETLGRLKRIKHLYVYFDNRLGKEYYKASDANQASSQDVDQLLNFPKQRLNANLFIKLEQNESASIATDVYSFYSTVFDQDFFDISPASTQFRPYTMFKEHLLGVGYAYQLGVWTIDESTFTLAGWQISNRIGGEKYINYGI